MSLLRIKDFDPDYTSTFGGEDIKGYDVYTEGTQEKIGTVDDILVNEHTGEFRYLLVALGVGTIGKKVLLPVGRSLMNPNVARVYARISKEQAYNLPELEPETTVDYDHEERVRGIYRPNATMSAVNSMAPVEASTPLEASAPLEATLSTSVTNAIPAPVIQPTYNRDSYTYKQDPSLYEMNPTDHQTLRLYEERITASKRRVKAGASHFGRNSQMANCPLR